MPTDFASRALLTLAGLAFGTSAFFFGYYGPTVWEPISLGCLALLLALLLARPATLRGASVVAVAGLLALWLWSLLSSVWAEAGDQAVTDANRWLLYAVVLALLLLLGRGPAARRLLIGSATAGVLAVVVYVLARLLLDQGGDLFVGNRLNEPLNYVNGDTAYLLVGFWPLVAVAERWRSPVVGGLSVFAAVQLLAMAILTQSRGGALALAATTAALLIVVPGRLPRAWALVAISLGVAISLPALRDVINAGQNGLTTPPDSTLRAAAQASLAGGAVAGAGWAAAASGAAALSRRSTRVGSSLRLTSIGAVTLIAVAGAAVALFPPGQRIDEIRDQFRAFTELRSVDPTDRLASGGGHRYDYWRIALNQFKDHPLGGVGAGNYDRTYYLERRTTEDINQAHSIELQTLGETGLIGTAALAAFVGAVLVGFWRRARSPDPEIAEPIVAVAAGGAFLVWLVHTSADWLHLIPGLTGIALCAAAVLLPGVRPARLRRPAIAAVIAAVLIGAAAYPVARQALALHLQSRGRDHLLSNPADALRDAKDSLALEHSLPTYYLEAAAYARLGLYRPARQTLLAASRSQPHAFVTWGLLGDLATRHGDVAIARHYYRHASLLNPRDSILARLARRPDAER